MIIDLMVDKHSWPRRVLRYWFPLSLLCITSGVMIVVLSIPAIAYEFTGWPGRDGARPSNVDQVVFAGKIAYFAGLTLIATGVGLPVGRLGVWLVGARNSP